MGGIVMVEAARLMPSRVIALVSVDSLIDVEGTMPPEELESFIAPFRKDFVGTIKEFVRGNMFTKKTDPAIIDAITDDVSKALPDVAISAMNNMFTYDTAGHLDEINVPVISINSDRYHVNAEGNRKHIKDYRLVFMEGYGHFLMIEAPQAFNRLLEAELTNLKR
jgi:pimeloyl-ACP methyl ester carboxylesterase